MADETLRDYYMRRFSEMRLERETFRSHWKDLSEYIEPRKGRFIITDRNRGDPRNQKIINSRATQALRNSQSGMFAGIMSPTRPWFKHETLDPDLMKREDVLQWLYQLDLLLRTILLEGNLYNMAPIALGETILFGTGAMSHVDDFQDVARFYTHTIGSYVIDQNERFEVDTFGIERDFTVKQIIQKYGLNNVSLSVRNAYDRGNYSSWYPVYQIIEPNPDYIEGRLNKKNKKYRSCTFEPGNNNKDQVLKEGGLEEFPVHCPRWSTTGTDIYATNCPGMVALGDVKSLQTLEKRKAQAIDKMVNPPLQGPPSFRNIPITALPGGTNLAASDGADDKGLRPLYQLDPRLQEMREDIKGIEQRINEAFFVDLFLAITSMEGIQPKNQLELTQRNQERLLMLGPPLQRLQSKEFLGGILERLFNQVTKAKILPPPPPVLQGQPLGTRYISSLAMAQKAAEVGDIERMALFTGQLAQINPQVVDKFNADEAIDQYARAIGVVPSVIVPEEQVQKTRQARAQMQEQAAQAQTAADQGKAANQSAAAVQRLVQTSQPPP